MPKILLQRLWEDRLDWDHPLFKAMCDIREKWHSDFPVLHDHLIPHSYFPKKVDNASTQLHELCDASESA